MDRITLTGMEFFGYHGVLPEENKLGQRFVVDLVLELDLHQAGLNDDLNATIN
ncbi:MAG: dihydroneopterin aldolase, partial [Selenomonadaceae bacterium]|nr:dihydroneopterin aldolase [Selenomonadaceae bacterium]